MTLYGNETELDAVGLLVGVTFGNVNGLMWRFIVKQHLRLE